MHTRTRIASICLGLACLTTGALALSGAAPSGSSAAATLETHVLRFSPEVLDLGEVTADTPAKATVTVTNTSSQPVTVQEIKPGCGCTKTSEPPKGPVAPGASFTIDITMDPGKRTGVDFTKVVHVVLTDGQKETLQIKGRVKSMVRVEPSVIDVAAIMDGGAASVTLRSVDGKDFAITKVVPEGMLGGGSLRSAGGQESFAIDLAAWERAGRPASLVVSTSRADAPEVAVPVKVSEAVAMFRMPAAAGGDARRSAIETEQDALIRTIDAGMPATSRSADFRMRLHRESGMLFVHGTADELQSVRKAVKALPAGSGVRESTGAPPA